MKVGLLSNEFLIAAIHIVMISDLMILPGTLFTALLKQTRAKFFNVGEFSVRTTFLFNQHARNLGRSFPALVKFKKLTRTPNMSV